MERVFSRFNYGSIYVVPRISQGDGDSTRSRSRFQTNKKCSPKLKHELHRPPHLIGYKRHQLLDHITPAVFLLESGPSALHHSSILDDREQMPLGLAQHLNIF